MNKNADRFIGPDASVNAPETPRSDPAAQLLAEFRQRWNHGDQPRVEMFFKSHPTLAEHPEIILDLIYQEVVLREEHGESVELSEYVQRFGKYERELADLFEIHRAVETSHARASTWNVFSQTSVGQHSRGPKEMSLPVIPGFSIESVLGRGGMGVVYKARQLELNRIVALKMVEVDDPERATERDRIRSEAQLVARMHHPNIVQIFEIGNHQGQPFLVLEFVDGGSLAQKLQGTPFDVNEAARLMITVCRAVQYAHDRRLIHRDVKPANVLLTESGEPKVADFGLAKLLDSDVSQSVSGAMVGTPSYMAPEQIDRRGRTVGPTADVYGLGAMLYEMLTGRPPFRAASFAQTLHQVLDDEPVSVRTLQPQLSRDLETICMKCLQKDPQKRYVSAALLADDLDRFLAGLTIHARPISVWQRTWRWSRRHRAAAALIGSVASFLLLTSTFLVWHSQTLAREEANARRNADMALDIAVEFERAADQMAFLPETKNLAQGLYERALQPVAELVARSPDNVKPRQILARLKERLAIHYSEAGEVEKAEMFIASAYEIIDGLFVEQPSAEHRAKRAEISRAYGQVLARRQEFSKALSMLDSSIADVQQLVADEPAQVNHQYRTAQMLLTRGDIRWSQLKGRPFDQQLFAAAERDLIEADSHAKKLSDGGQLEPLASDLRGEILSVLVSLYAFRSRSQPDGEWELRTANGFEEMVTLYKQLRQQYPKTAKYRELLVQAYRERAEWMNDIHPAEATPFLETLIQNAEALATDKPELLRNRLLLIGDRQKLADRILIDSDSRLESGQALVEDRIRQVLRLVRLSRELSQQLAEALQVQADDLYKPADRVGTELWAYALLGEFDQAELLSGEFEELADSGLASHLVSASNFAYFDFLIDRLPTVNPADLTDRRHIWKTKAVESLRKAAAHAGFHIKMVRNDQYLARLQEFPPMQELLTELELREKSVVPTESTSVPQ